MRFKVVDALQITSEMIEGVYQVLKGWHDRKE